MITSDLQRRARFTARIDKSVGRAVRQATLALLPADLQRFRGVLPPPVKFTRTPMKTGALCHAFSAQLGGAPCWAIFNFVILCLFSTL